MSLSFLFQATHLCTCFLFSANGQEKASFGRDGASQTGMFIVLCALQAYSHLSLLCFAQVMCVQRPIKGCADLKPPYLLCDPFCSW